MRYQVACLLAAEAAPRVVVAEDFEAARALALQFLATGATFYGDHPAIVGAVSGTHYPPSSIVRIDLGPAPDLAGEPPMLHLEVPFTPGRKVGLSAQRKADHAWFDFAANAFAAPGVVPAALTTPMTERADPLAGLYELSYGPTPGAIWWDGDVLIGIHDLGPAAPDATAPPFVPYCHIRFAVPFANGNSLYQPPPFYSY